MDTGAKGKTKATGAKGKAEATGLKKFLSSLATDPRKLGEFLHKPEAAMAAANLSEADKTALRSGVAGMVAARLAGVPLDEAFQLKTIMYAVWYNKAVSEPAPMYYYNKAVSEPAPMYYYNKAVSEPVPMYYYNKAVSEPAYPPAQYVVYPPQFVVQPPPQYVIYPPQFVVQPPPQYVIYPPQFVVQPPPQYVIYPPQFVVQPPPYYPR